MAKVFQNDIEKLEQNLRLEGKSDNTIYQYKRAWKRYSEAYEVFSEEAVRSYLGTDNNNTSVNRALFRHMINIKDAGFSLPKYKKKYRKLPKTLSEYQVGTILDNISKDYRDLIQLLVETGARISEALNIKYEDIDHDNNTIKVTGKGDKQRLLRPSPELINSLLSNDQYTGYVFNSDYREGPITRQTISNHIKKVIPHVSPHMFRHTFATTVYNETEGDLLATKELLGHENIETTSIYAKISDARVKDAVKTAWRKKE